MWLRSFQYVDIANKPDLKTVESLLLILVTTLIWSHCQLISWCTWLIYLWYQSIVSGFSVKQLNIRMSSLFWRYLTRELIWQKSIFHKTLKDDIIAIWLVFCCVFIEKEPVFLCSVLNKGTTGTIFVTSLVWRGPWLGIEPGTSRTRIVILCIFPF